MSQYVRERWGAEQGFPRGPVYAITQTIDGYLWFGVEAGLLRFDGLKFELIRGQPNAFQASSVLGLAPGKDGSLWVGLRDRNMMRYRNGSFEDAFPGRETPASITAMSFSRTGDLLAAKLQRGALTYRNGSLQLLAGATRMPRSPIISVAQSGDGAIWLGTRGSGLFRLENEKTLSVSQGMPDPKANCLLPDGAKDLWIGTDRGLVRWNGKELTNQGIPAALQDPQILALVKDRDSNLWVGTDSQGLLRFNAQGVSQLVAPLGAITALFEDREGNLWIGSANGVERLRDSAFVTYSGPEGVPTDGSNPVLVDSRNRTWFPPVNGGLWWLQEERRGKVMQAGLDNDVVYSLTGTGDELWIARQRGGLTQLQTGDNGFKARTYTKADGLAQNSVYSVHQARDGTVWAGTLSAGVSHLNGKRFTTYTIADGLASNTVASILEASDGTMWFATPTGLSSLSKGRWRTFSISQGLPSENINCVLEDSAGLLWVGTTAGIAFRKPGGFIVPARLPAPLREQILGMAEDKYGSLWIATSNHVLRVKRDALLRGELTPEDVREYGLSDGLRGIEGVKRHRSVVADSLGRIWFSLNHGISVVDPARLTRTSAPAKVHIQRIAADGLPIEMQSRIYIPPGRQRIVFGYSALILSVPGRVRFRYRLEGFDRSWSDAVAGREAVYTNLGPGLYRFRVTASNADGAWSSDDASVAFEVNPAVWQTWWFRAAMIVACLLAALAVYRLRMRQLTSGMNVRFEERLAERTRIAQELHDTLLQGFLSASMQVHVATDALPADSQVRPSLNRSLQLMRQVIAEGRNAVRGLRSAQSVSLDLEHAFSRIQDEVTPVDSGNGQAVDFRVIIEGQQTPLQPVLRDEVYSIGREALINAFRHARAKHVVMECKYSSRRLAITVRDDGCGIDSRILRAGREGHWGISGMREKADRIGAKLQLWSSPDLGTEVKLTVPGHIAFHNPRRFLWSRLRDHYLKGKNIV